MRSGANCGPCVSWDDRGMAEYGEGVGNATGVGNTLGGGTGGTQDLGAGVSAFLNDAAYTVQVMPPEQLLLLIVVVALAGFVFLRKAL